MSNSASDRLIDRLPANILVVLLTGVLFSCTALGLLVLLMVRLFLEVLYRDLPESCSNIASSLAAPAT